MTDQPEQPTPEDQAKVQQVMAASAPAIAEGKDPAEAMKEERDKQGFSKLSDEDIDQIASKFNEMNIAAFEQRGAFDPPPEPVQPPTQPEVPAQGEQPAQEAHTPAPEKRTFAHRFMGMP